MKAIAGGQANMSDDGGSLRWGSGSHSMSRIEMVFTVALAAAFMGVTAVLLIPLAWTQINRAKIVRALYTLLLPGP